MVVLSIFILLVFVSSASAADTNGTDVLSVDESASINNEKLALDYSLDNAASNDTNVLKNNANNLLSADNNDGNDLLSMDNNKNVLKSSEGTLKDLQKEIDSASGYVILKKDIVKKLLLMVMVQ